MRKTSSYHQLLLFANPIHSLTLLCSGTQERSSGNIEVNVIPCQSIFMNINPRIHYTTYRFSHTCKRVDSSHAYAMQLARDHVKYHPPFTADFERRKSHTTFPQSPLQPCSIDHKLGRRIAHATVVGYNVFIICRSLRVCSFTRWEVW